VNLIFDIETDNLLDKMTKIHCIVAQDVDTKEIFQFYGDTIREGVELLQGASMLVGHNVIDFDIPAIQKIYSWFNPEFVRDTLVMSRLIYADLKERDFKLVKRDSEFPKKYIGSHSLKAWGYRLNNYKTDYEGGFEEFNQEMLDYCVQDVNVTATLWDKLNEKDFSDQSIQLEHEIASIILEQERYGFAFDRDGAVALYSDLLDRRRVIDKQLANVFPPWDVKTPFVPKVNRKDLGYEKGVPTYKVKTIEFNPGSRDHVSQKLKEKYGWKPEAYTPEGKPKVDETVLEALPYEEAQLLAERFLLTKRIGQVAEGKHSWLNTEKNGVIHGRVNTNGAVTGRMTHHSPNVAQVPSTRALYGDRCRTLFRARHGKVLVGCDADGLELRCLAGFMAYYDDGEYVDTVLKGDKEAGTDMHSINARVLGCDRDPAKKWFYAFIYGAGDAKLGSLLGEGPRRGKDARKSFLSALPALNRLIEEVGRRVETRGYLRGLDGRKLFVRSSHSALNTLLQSAGAIFMKQALVFCNESMGDLGKFVANVHDEWQIETGEDNAERVGRIAVDSIRNAGKHFDFRCPLDANYAIGKTWADTH